jgi:transcriptional regulator GlxA family with amidase domain
MDARVTIAIEMMRNSIAEELSTRRLSDRVNLSPMRLRQLFKKETGRSPMQYLKHMRMKHTEVLLLNTFLTVKEITLRCGISDVSHFVRDFKKQHGLRPSEFRARSRSPLKDTDRFTRA